VLADAGSIPAVSTNLIKIATLQGGFFIAFLPIFIGRISTSLQMCDKRLDVWREYAIA